MLTSVALLSTNYSALPGHQPSMSTALRLAITADLHWGTHENGDEATRMMLEFLRQEPPDLLILAGDIGAAHHFEECLKLFDNLACRKAAVPGNHDIWV